MLIYKITNKINGKIYIGQTLTTIKRRWSGHCVPNNSCVALSRAIAKYGKENFTIEVMVKCESIAQMNLLEVEFIKIYDCLAPKGYNLRKGGENSTHSAISRQRMSVAQKGRKRNKPSWNKGLSSWSKGLKHTDAHRAAMSKSMIKSRIIDCYGIVYDSISEAAESLNTSTGKVCAVLKGTRPHTRGRTFTLLEKYRG